ncbi:MAG: YggT family protein [Clostridioides sp.]|jgi:YggT family protein|nr:YggT family protein [Clostridioides sp.]
MVMIKTVLIYLLEILSYAIIIKALMTWFPGGRESKFYELLDTLTEPIEGPVRKIMGRFVNGPVDFSPIVALLLVGLLRRLVFFI